MRLLQPHGSVRSARGGGFVPVGPRSATAPYTRPHTKHTRTPTLRGDTPAESRSHRCGPHRNTSNTRHPRKQSRGLPSGVFRNRQGWQRCGPRKEEMVSQRQLRGSPVLAAAKADWVSWGAVSRRGDSQGLWVLSPLPAFLAICREPCSSLNEPC